MPALYQFTPRALSDVEGIWNFIAKDNLAAANRVESVIFEACGRLAERPLLGCKRSEITTLPVRFWTVTRFPNFIVVYRPKTKPLQVIAVLNGKRDIKALFEEPNTL
jgi:plasmid stabilization system protein ParE